MKSNDNSKGQIFWTNDDNGFSEDQSIYFPVTKGFHTYKIELPKNTSEISKYRIDPSQTPNCNSTISYILLKRKFHKAINIHFDSLINFNSAQIINKGARLTLKSLSNDPHFTFSSPKRPLSFDYHSIVFFGIICILSYLIITLSLNAVTNLLQKKVLAVEDLIPLFLLIIFISSLALAIVSRTNASPDELDHFYAAEYFKTHIDTPPEKVDAASYTYNTQWGYSRVYQLGRNYLLAGQFSNIITDNIPTYKSVRLFGVFLIFLFLLLSISYTKQAVILLPFIMTPQAWYVFSYVNDDYFPLFLSFLIFFITETSKDQVFKNEKYNLKVILKLILLGFLLGNILISKAHFLIVGAVYILYIFGETLALSDKKTYHTLLSSLQKPLLILSLGVSILGIRHLMSIFQEQRYSANDMSAQFYQQIELNRKQFFETTIKTGQEMFLDYISMMPNWLESTYKSFNGVYGYMEYLSSEWVYSSFKILHLLLLLQLIYFLRKKYTQSKFIYFTLLCGVLLGLVFASSYLFSFSYAYQPQGRYLLPFLPVFGLVLSKLELPKRNLMVIFFLLFILSLYSYFTVAMLYLT